MHGSSFNDSSVLQALDPSIKRHAPTKRLLTGSALGAFTDCVRQLDRHFQILGRPEGDLFAGLDLDCFSGSGIAPHASSPLPDLQDT